MGRVAHLHVMDIATGRVKDLLEGSDFELQRSRPRAPVAFDICRPTAAACVFAYNPNQRPSAATAALTLAEIDPAQRASISSAGASILQWEL